MKILVCGSRDWADAKAITDTLDAYRAQDVAKGWTTVIIQGGASGADAIADGWARGVGVVSLTFPADWPTHGRGAGPIRNQRMLDEGMPDVVLAFRCEGVSKGTDDMVRRARVMLPGDCVHVIPGPRPVPEVPVERRGA